MAKGSDKGEIDAKQAQFVTNLEETHAANPKPLYKTHKCDCNDNMVDPVPIRTLTVGVNTPVQPLSKFCQLGIEHLTSKKELPRRSKSTKEVLQRVTIINENYQPINPEALLVFPDIKAMYPNTDINEGLASIHRRLLSNPSPLGLSAELLVEGLRICLECNCVQFQGKFYLPCRGCAMGPCHACDFTDVWIGDVMEKHINTCPVETLDPSIYRDDMFDVLKQQEDLQQFKDHLESIHDNLTFDVRSGKEGEYLDLWLMLKDGSIEWKVFTKTPPVYLSPKSCHDPQVFKGIHKGVGHRLRINSSTDQYFEEAVEEYSQAFTVSCYSYKKTKNELMKFKTKNPVDMIKDTSRRKEQNSVGCKVFYVGHYDPRVPHPRKLISKNYHLIANSPVVSKLFPRGNLVSGTKRLPNLSEILSPTVPRKRSTSDPGDGSDGRPGDNRDVDNDENNNSVGTIRWNGSYHCENYKKGKNCDVCSHMQERSFVTSFHFKTKHAIHGHLVHRPACEKTKLTWYVVVVVCLTFVCTKMFTIIEDKRNIERIERFIFI